MKVAQDMPDLIGSMPLLSLNRAADGSPATI